MCLYFSDEEIEIELLQVADFGNYDIRLSSFTANARDFLYPYRTIWPSCSSGLREMLLFKRTPAYPLSVSRATKKGVGILCSVFDRIMFGENDIYIVNVKYL